MPSRIDSKSDIKTIATQSLLKNVQIDKFKNEAAYD